jgi:hypothetical protein
LVDGSAWSTFAGDDFGGERVMIEFKGSHFERDVILWAVRWYVAYPISYRQLEEMMEEHGVEVDHATRFCRKFPGRTCDARRYDRLYPASE